MGVLKLIPELIIANKDLWFNRDPIFTLKNMMVIVMCTLETIV